MIDFMKANEVTFRCVGLNYDLMFVLTINTCFQCNRDGSEDDGSV